ncbi:MAG: hypothetical protein ISR73_04335 [Gammaproteobacteria bacterium]|nr:hypothetical protein [Gammaproteobacteria bacterium]
MSKTPILISAVLVLLTLPAVASAFRFPEISFCPLGGPPGWFNRLSGEHDRRYYPPPPVMSPRYYPAVAPYGWPGPTQGYSPATPPIYYR